MAALQQTAVWLTVLPVLARGLQLVPPLPLDSIVSTSDTAELWQLESSPQTIYIEDAFADVTDTDGLTLIPPSALQFAEVFQQDLNEVSGVNWTIQRVDRLPTNASGILLGAYAGDGSEFLNYEDGSSSTEGYELSVSSTNVYIGGTGARGMWWGTRTVLQLLLVNDGTLPVGLSGLDSPAYRTRGFMLDAGRKWYAPSMLKELCSFASFFKLSEFHYHLSDNYPLNRGKNETWQDVYSHFSLRPEDPELLGILHGRENETLSRDDFLDLQSHCASRGVTVIPEIEAPGHCLYLTKWKPELALPKRDLLNLSHPDTLPTIQRIWSEFLPWFETKEVHIGADEYDPTLADDYITFVNDMAEFVNSTSGKSVRIWGTDEPSENLTISQDVLIQHWQYGQSDPLLVVEQGYDLINSQDWWAYTSIKNDHMPILPARYPQFFNESRVLNFADQPGWQWTPADFNPVNTTMQVNDGEPLNRGAILAAWNDNGPDASTQLEAYYSMRRGIALVGSRSWSGNRGHEVDPDTFSASVDFFSPLAPAQNLDRVLSTSNDGSDTSTIATWTASDDGSHIGYGSKGMNYTLTLNATGPFSLSGPDNILTLEEDGKLIFNADGYVYPLRSVSAQDALELDPGHPGRIWVNATGSSHEEVTVTLPATITIAADTLHGCVAWINGELVGRFEVFVYGGRNTQFSWSQMAFVAPLDDVEGSGLQGLAISGSFQTPDGSQTPPPVPGAAADVGPGRSWLSLVVMSAMTAALMM
jgi:hexosaminidase